IAGRGKPQQQWRIRLDGDAMWMKVCDYRKSSERGRTAVVQPVPRVKWLRRFGIGAKPDAFDLEDLGQIEPGKNGRDLEPAQRPPAGREVPRTRLLEEIDPTF